MSERVPTCRVGEKVRIMQTSTANQLGVGGQIGHVLAVNGPPNDLEITIQLTSGSRVEVPASSVMRMQ